LPDWSTFFATVTNFSVIAATGPAWELVEFSDAKLLSLFKSWWALKENLLAVVGALPILGRFLWGDRALLGFRGVWWKCLSRAAFMDLLVERFPEALRRYWRGDELATVFHYAAQAGDAEMIARLCYLDDLDPNMPNDSGQTPIMLAIEAGAVKAVKALLIHPLLDLGFVPAVATETAFSVAIKVDLDCDTFWEHPTLDFRQMIGGALTVKGLVTMNKVALFHKLFSSSAILRGRDVNALDANGKGLLHYAVDARNIEMITRILNHVSFRVFAREEIGRTVAPLKTTDPAIKRLIAERFKRARGWG
jgi:hypothetical protein